MPNRRQPPYVLAPAVLALSAFVLALSLAWSVPAVLAAGPANAQANELVRLINGERAYLGKAPLRVDTFLASKARDGAVTCPNDASKVMQGRAKDFAVFGFPANAHQLRLCPTYTSMDAMASWGYTGSRGEITALNGGYGTSMVDYKYGCTPSLRTCPGSTTQTYYTTDRAMWDWTSSATHYAIIIGSYDRVGCGAWIGSNGAYFYDCLFSQGGPSVPKATPRPTGTARPAAAPTAVPTAGPRSAPTPAQIAQTSAEAPTPTFSVPTAPGPSGSPAEPALPSTEPAATPTAAPAAGIDRAQGVNGPSPGPDALLGGTLGGGSRGDAPSGDVSVPATPRNLSVAAGAITAILSLFYGLLLSLKRRRPRGQLASR